MDYSTADERDVNSEGFSENVTGQNETKVSEVEEVEETANIDNRTIVTGKDTPEGGSESGISAACAEISGDCEILERPVSDSNTEECVVAGVASSTEETEESPGQSETVVSIDVMMNGFHVMFRKGR